MAIWIFLNQGAESTAALNIGHVGLWKSSVLSVVAGITGQFLTVNRCTSTEGVLFGENAMVYAEGSCPDVEDRVRVVDSFSLENLYESTPHSLILGICVYLRQVVSVVVADPVSFYRLNTNFSIMDIVGRNVLSGVVRLNFAVYSCSDFTGVEDLSCRLVVPGYKGKRICKSVHELLAAGSVWSEAVENDNRSPRPRE